MLLSSNIIKQVDYELESCPVYPKLGRASSQEPAFLDAIKIEAQTILSNAKALEKLSSGQQINRAGDNAAGLAISEKMRAQIRGLNQAESNAQDGISLIQTAEGALIETTTILQRMRELAVQAASDTNTESDRINIQDEINQLASEITRISTDTEFNSKKLLNGEMGKTFAVTANSFDSSLQNVKINGNDITSGPYTITATVAGTDTVTVGANTIHSDPEVTPEVVAGNITVADGAKFGSYKLNVTNYNSVANTADFELVGPDGSSITLSGKATNAALEIGDITFAFNDSAVTQNGTLEFNLTNAGIKFDLSGNKTVDMAAIASYAGETINLGGFQFEVRWGAATDGDKLSVNVTDKSIKFQIGSNSNQNTSLFINQMGAEQLGVNNLVVTNREGASSAITAIDSAIAAVSNERSKLGALQNKLEHTINGLGASAENLTAAESRIRDVNMAKEMMNFTKMNILQQAASAMLAQANQAPQQVLQLLR
jgi:flagellin